MHHELLTEILSKGPGEYLGIEKIDDVGRFNIMLAGAQPSYKFRPSSIPKLCGNVVSWRYGDAASGDNDITDSGDDSTLTWKDLQLQAPKSERGYLYARDNYLSMQCAVRMHTKQSGKISGKQELDVEDISVRVYSRNSAATPSEEADRVRDGEGEWVYLPLWTSLAAGTRLTALNRSSPSKPYIERTCAFNLP
ncbi:hypothetical protein SG09_38140 [Bradyrhizobium ottawaense]|nr:hypothetical protein SG09_38140 [Bradyrhizobium ottawaense]